MESWNKLDIYIHRNKFQIWRSTEQTTDYTDFSYTLPGKAEQAYSVHARHATVPCNVYWLKSHDHLLHSGVKFNNFWRNTPILNINHNVYEYFFYFAFRFQRILKYSWIQMFSDWLCTVLHYRTCCGKYRIL